LGEEGQESSLGWMMLIAYIVKKVEHGRKIRSSAARVEILKPDFWRPREQIELWIPDAELDRRVSRPPVRRDR
jgi:hypothetical protein